MYKSMLLITILFAASLLIAPGADAGPLKVGAALRVVTPDPLLPVSGGVGEPEPVKEKKGDLFARVMVFEKDGVKVAIVGMDFLGWTSILGNKIRAQVDGIPPENILIGSTHTHSAPDTYGFPDEKGRHGADIDYLNHVCDLAAEAINEAAANVKPACLKIAVADAKGKIAYNYYAPQLYDPRCGVIQAIGTTGADKGKVIATLVNYASHPEVLGAGRGILSPDYCGPLYDKIEAETGGMALFMNGALGGMITADNRTGKDSDSRTWEECVRIGELLASEALRIVEKAPLQEDPVLYCAAETIHFPIDSKMLRYVLTNSPMGYKLPPDGRVPSQLNLVNIGSAQLLTLPGEVLPNVGYYLKRNMPTDDCFLLGLTNDAFGYIMAKVDWRSFERYKYISFTGLGEMTGEILMDESLKLIAASPKPDPEP